MPFVAADPYERIGEVIDTGHCMRHVQVVAGVPHSSLLRRGERLATMAAPPRGVVVGTFGGEPPRYQNRTDGSSHVCILIARNADNSLRVVDQWVGKAVSERIIEDRGGMGSPVDDASCYYVVESTDGAQVA